MPILRIEHPVSNFDAWKQTFDSDPFGRERSGVRRHRILRGLDDPNYVTVDLEFDTAREAEAVHTTLKGLWRRRVEEGLVEGPWARMLETVESKDYSS